MFRFHLRVQDVGLVTHAEQASFLNMANGSLLGSEDNIVAGVLRDNVGHCQ